MKIFKNLIIILLNSITKYLPRNSKIWLYGGFSDYFIDNSKYFFITINSLELDIRHIWISNRDEEIIFLNSLGYECYKKWSICGIFFALRAKVYIYSSYPSDVANYALSGGVFLFNLWHGLPLKKIEYDIDTPILMKYYKPQGLMQLIEVYKYLPPQFRKSKSVLCPNSKFESIFISAFRLSNSDVCFATYPRTYIFYYCETDLIKHITKFEKKETLMLVLKCKSFEKVWIYMPTWRDANQNFLFEAIPNIELLNEVCKKNNILFIMKLHLSNSDVFNTQEYENIHFIKNSIDIYPVLPYTTTLLTDYSSIIFDYQILNRNIVYYPFDLEDYIIKSRSLYFDYNFIIDGVKIFNFYDLIELINKDVFINRSFPVSSYLSFIESETNKISLFIKNKIDE
jgi:CDP-glycerol glycerophosphotransferase (TagB/SpsB family)